MSRIAGCFARLAETGRKALIPYVVAGDPGPEITVDLMHRLVAAGADILDGCIHLDSNVGDGIDGIRREL